MMAELGLIALAGLLGSSHCVGMCGGFAMIIGLSATTRRRVLLRQCAYSAGRVFTYSMLGAVAGLIGVRVISQTTLPGAINVAAAFSILCGLFLIVEGISAAGFSLWRKSPAASGCGSCLSGVLLGSFLRGPSIHHAFLGGILTGFLPCGLVYAFLALAAAKADPLHGMAVMAAFGLGTIPLMVITGVGSTLLGLAARQRLLRLAAICVILTGVVTVARGAGFLGSRPEEGTSCPFCATQTPPEPADSLPTSR